MNLEKMIVDAYSKHQQELRAKEQKQKDLEQAMIQKAIAQLKSRLDEVISPEVQEALGVEFTAKIYDSVIAKFTYKGTQFCIQYGPYSGGQWGVSEHEDSDCLSHVRSEGLLNYRLIQRGEIRASFEPEMTLEKAADILDDCLALAEDVYTHRHDFIHNPEEFGSSLKAAICFMSKLLGELAESEEDSE